MNNKYNIEYWFKPKNKIFKDFRNQTINYHNKKKRRVFISRNSTVLFIAHLDTVYPPELVKTKGKKTFARGCDDRLGAFLAYTLSKKLGADLLLTDNEESGQSTAESHKCKSYNWIVNFDRQGNDVVTYDLDNPKFLTALGEYWKIGWGSFSDICFLNTKACCMNLGIGYFKAHDKKSYFLLDMVQEQASLFVQFFKKYKDVKFVQKPQTNKFRYFSYKSVYSNSTTYDFEDFYADKPNDVVNCEWCGQPVSRKDTTFIESFRVCPNCHEDIKEYYYSMDKDYAQTEFDC